MRWAATFVLLGALVAVPAHTEPALRFNVDEGAIHNAFFRHGPIAAHLTLKSGQAPRIIIAFPAGNSGAGLWFEHSNRPTSWQTVSPMRPVIERQPYGGIRRGVSTIISTDAATLTLQRAVLGSVRSLRDYGYTGTVVAAIDVAPVVSAHSVVWNRRRVDGGAGYRMALEVLNGSVSGGGEAPITLTADHGRAMRLRITAVTGDPPLTPIPSRDIFASCAASDVRLRNALTFLSYDEKLLAGSWRFNTYFGRDTLLSTRLLMPALRPRPIEAAFASVFARLNADGEVAHEEDIGEYPLLTRMAAGQDVSADPILDYKMVDDDFLLAPTLVHYLLDTADGRTRAAAFLARRDANGVRYGDLLVRNLRHVASKALPFARTPDHRHLIALHDGSNGGNWRDSENGLGGDGRYPYDINAVLVPAALQAIARLDTSGLLAPYAEHDAPLSEAAAMAAVWEREAPRLFAVHVDADDGSARVAHYAASLSPPAPMTSDAPSGPADFPALALDTRGRPVEVMHSDIAFLLLFANPDADALRTALISTMLPFPAGLMTPVGMVTANPAYATPARYAIFDRSRYHGTVIWSWSQGMLAAGLKRQLARNDLPVDVIDLLQQSKLSLDQSLLASRDFRGSELWSWALDNGQYRAVHYGQGSSDETESNAIQLWSTIGLAVQNCA